MTKGNQPAFPHSVQSEYQSLVGPTQQYVRADAYFELQSIAEEMAGALERYFDDSTTDDVFRTTLEALTRYKQWRGR